MIVWVLGAYGRLGTALCDRFDSVDNIEYEAFTRKQADITDLTTLQKQWDKYVSNPDVLINCAAMVGLQNCEDNWEEAWNVNYLAVDQLQRFISFKPSTRLIHISTDYVYNGENGPHNEGEPLKPKSYYAMTKMLGDLCCKQVIRTSFMPNDVSGYEFGYTDKMTSSDYVDEIAAKMIILIQNYDEWGGAINVGGSDTSFFDLIKWRKPNVKPKKCPHGTPKDTRMDQSKYNRFYNTIRKE